MDNESYVNNSGFKFSFWNIVLNVFLFILVVFLVLILAYLFYQNVPGEPVSLDSIIINKPIFNNLSSEVSQFFPNMKFNHNQISYSIDPNCDRLKSERMLEAFYYLENKVDSITFYEGISDVDIDVSCSELNQPIKGDYFIAGEGGAREIIQTERYNVITNGTILLYYDFKKTLKCDWPNIELHELIHVFGFGHSENKKSLMYPYLDSCEQELDEEIINKIEELYSKENLPDLYFDEVSAVKKGRYLDFNVTIKNSGTINAPSTNLTILDDGDIASTFSLNELNYGSGVYIEITNSKLNHKNPKQIVFVLDMDNQINEIDELNNNATIDFD